MAMDFMPPVTALVDEGQLEESPDVGSFAGEGYEEGHVDGVILRALPVRVEVDRPGVAAEGEGLGGDVFAHAHAFDEGVAADLELVCAVEGFRMGG